MNKKFVKWLQKGIEAGWVSDIVCDTHDGLPQTEEEGIMWEAGEDPCIHGVRVYVDRLF